MGKQTLVNFTILYLATLSCFGLMFTGLNVFMAAAILPLIIIAKRIILLESKSRKR